MNHTIHLDLPINSGCRLDVSIIAASETQVYLILRSAFHWNFYLASGHPLIPNSWQMLGSPQRMPSTNFVYPPRPVWLSGALSPDESTICLGFSQWPEELHKRVIFRRYDITTDRWKDLCIVEEASVECLTHTSHGWLALTAGIEENMLRLYKIEQGEAVLLKSMDQSHQQAFLGGNNLYLYSQPHARITIYPLESLEKPQELSCQGQLKALSEINGQLYSIEHEQKVSALHKVRVEGGVCKLQKALLRSRMPVWSGNRHRSSMIDANNFYSIFSLEARVYLSVQSHSHTPSLQNLALLGIQKMFGIKRQVKCKLIGRPVSEGAVCDVWEGGHHNRSLSKTILEIVLNF